MPSPCYPVRLPPALEAACRSLSAPQAPPGRHAGQSQAYPEATIWRYLQSEMGSQGRRQYCIFPQPPGRQEERDDDQSGGEGQRRLPRL